VTGDVYCPTTSPVGPIPLAAVGNVLATPASAPNTSMVVNCSPLNRNPCCIPTPSI